MNNQTFGKQELEIDLKEFIWEILSQWKAILLVSIIVAFVVCGAKYAKDFKNESAAAIESAKKAELTTDEQIDEIINSLPATEVDEVVYIVNQKELLRKLKTYLNNSILNNTDPTDQRILYLTYNIETEDSSDLPSLMQSYRSFVKGDSFSESIKNTISPESDTIYISELIYFEEEEDDNSSTNYYNFGGGSLSFGIVLPVDADLDAVSKASTTAIDKYGEEINKRQPNTVTLAGANEVHIFHRQNAVDRADIYQKIYNLTNNVKTTESSLSENQIMAIEAIMKIKESTEKATEVENVENINSETINEDMIASPKLNKKYFVLGFLIGAFIYVCAYMGVLALKKEIISAKTLTNYTGLKLLGEVYYVRKPEGIRRLFHSKLVDKYHYQGKEITDIQTDKLTDVLDAVCEKVDIDKVTLYRMTERAESLSIVNEIIDIIKEKAKAKGINMNEICFTESFDEKTMLNENEAVLMVDGNTKADHLNKLMNLFADYQVKTLGSIFVKGK